MFIILLILQLLFILPFYIFAGLSIAKGIRGYSYVLKPFHFYFSLLLLIASLSSLLINELGFLSLSVFVTYTFFLSLAIFYKQVHQVKPNVMLVTFKTVLFLLPLIELIFINLLFVGTLNNEVFFPTTNTTPSPITGLIPTMYEVKVVPLVTLLLISSSCVQLIVYLIDQLTDRLYKGKYESKRV